MSDPDPRLLRPPIYLARSRSEPYFVVGAQVHHNTYPTAYQPQQQINPGAEWDGGYEPLHRSTVGGRFPDPQNPQYAQNRQRQHNQHRQAFSNQRSHHVAQAGPSHAMHRPTMSNVEEPQYSQNQFYTFGTVPEASLNAQVDALIQQRVRELKYISAGQLAAQLRVVEDDNTLKMNELKQMIVNQKKEADDQMRKLRDMHFEQKKSHDKYCADTTGEIKTVKEELATSVRTLSNTTKAMEDLKISHEKELADIQGKLNDVLMELAGLKEYAVTEDAFWLIWIRFRALFDQVVKILHETITGDVSSDERLKEAKNWWNSLSPPWKRRPEVPDTREKDVIDKERASLDAHRFAKCKSLLKSKGLAELPIFQALVAAGSLEYITQDRLDMRDKANEGAHHLLAMSRFHGILDHALTEDGSKICAREDVSNLRGLIHFVEGIEKNIAAAASSFGAAAAGSNAGSNSHSTLTIEMSGKVEVVIVTDTKL
ncbi:hypothetical protein BDN70DRAFT_939220 [Pholiota conissans]|uniref:Uncharacterized protein n=1 Tax=Pholiota conissans TaxID=109636 RepID=A0A9P6CSI1_9AGAR|nr:hypothetical protein BDN70DRAFT_939220 [Pholiota conissans]